MAPPLLPIEVTNILRQRMRREGVALADAHQRLTHFLTFPITLRAPAELYEAALTLATYNLSAAYDAHYLALAQVARL